MKIGDLIMHRTTGWTGIVVGMSDEHMLRVWTHLGPGSWRALRCEVIS